MRANDRPQFRPSWAVSSPPTIMPRAALVRRALANTRAQHAASRSLYRKQPLRVCAQCAWCAGPAAVVSGCSLSWRLLQSSYPRFLASQSAHHTPSWYKSPASHGPVALLQCARRARRMAQTHPYLQRPNWPRRERTTTWRNSIAVGHRPALKEEKPLRSWPWFAALGPACARSCQLCPPCYGAAMANPHCTNMVTFTGPPRFRIGHRGTVPGFLLCSLSCSMSQHMSLP